MSKPGKPKQRCEGCLQKTIAPLRRINGKLVNICDSCMRLLNKLGKDA